MKAVVYRWKLMRILLGACLLLVQNSFAQHPPLYSQYMFNTMLINPAYTGSRNVLSLCALGRQQWVGFKGAPSTQTFAAHTPLRNPRNNFGLIFSHDQYGVSENTGIFASYAYRIQFGDKSRLAMGLQAGATAFQDRWTKLKTDEVNDGTFIADSPVFWVPRAGFGLYYDRKDFYAGFSVPQLLKYESPTLEAYNVRSFQYRHFFFTAGYVFMVNPDLVLKPSILVRYLKNSPVQMDINLNLIFKDLLWIGTSYRTGDAITATMQFQISNQVQLGYAFDYSLSRLRSYNQGTHELMLRYEFNYGMKVMSPRYF